MKITDDIFKSIFNESVWIPITISLKFVPKGPIDYNSALVRVVAWHRTGEKPLPASMLTQFTDSYIRTRGEKNNQDIFTVVQYILLHFVGIHLKYSILYLKRCLSVPSHYQYWLQIIDIHPRAISQNISKIWWQFFYAPVNGQWVN